MFYRVKLKNLNIQGERERRERSAAIFTTVMNYSPQSLSAAKSLRPGLSV